MGFYSAFITDQLNIDLPDWFLEKWGEYLHFNPPNKYFGLPTRSTLPISSKHMYKTYGDYPGLGGREIGFAPAFYSDLQKVLPEDAKVVLVWLHECGGITRIQIEKNRVIFSEPETWRHDVGDIEHDYCYGCSDPTKGEIKK